jgi:hypothetical protein
MKSDKRLEWEKILNQMSVIFNYSNSGLSDLLLIKNKKMFLEQMIASAQHAFSNHCLSYIPVCIEGNRLCTFDYPIFLLSTLILGVSLVVVVLGSVVLLKVILAVQEKLHKDGHI